MKVSQPEITRLLRAWEGGDREALDQLTLIVHDELRRAAGNYLRHERPGHTLQATALVNEVYIRLIDMTGIRWQDRAHFFAIAATMMRRILLDAARARGAEKRGGDGLRVTLDENMQASNQAAELIAVDDALQSLSQVDPRKAQVVELRFFGGLNIDEIAEVLGISPQSVKRDWKLAKAWLLSEIAGKAPM
jgi:RNA polymerase sigma factor (TIGR02999 family)